MANPVLIGAKLNLKRSALEGKEQELNVFLEKREELSGSIEGIESEEDLDVIEVEINKLEEEIKGLEEQKSKLEEEINELETELEQSNRKSPLKGAKKNMTNINNQELRSEINNAIRTKSTMQERAGFKVVDGGILIPEELLTPEKELHDVVDLLQYVKRVPVTTGSGKYPVISKSGTKMNTVAELEANPELAKPTVIPVPYAIETYRGFIPVSQEGIDDADYDIVGLIDEEIRDQELNTRNFAIATVLKTAKAKTVTTIDELITHLNLDFKQAYNVKLYVSASFFNVLDVAKAGDGTYLLSSDITVASGKRFKGKEVVVLDDDVIGNAAGDKVAFIGDAKAFCKFFDRKQVSVKWVDNNIYGQMLAGFVRFNAVKGDEEAGFYVTFNPTVVPGA